MDDLTIAGATLGGGNAPSPRGGCNDDLADLRSSLTERFVAIPDGAAAACSTGVVCLNDGDPGEVDLGLFGEDHRQGREDSLTHLGFVQNKLDLSIGMNADPGVEGIFGNLRRGMVEATAKREPYDKGSTRCCG